ncbi:MAG: carbamoyltransferase [Gammaproteobacteria bacterium]|nr:carbamoyltransferase [Gammaproteobacteria bacterium]
MRILGLNAYHGDSAAALVVDGELIAAAEEERFRRIKHWAGLPTESIRYCLEEAGIGLDQVDAIAINQDSKANLWKKIGFTLAKRPDLSLVLDRIKNKREREGVESQLAHAFPGQHFNGKVHRVEHHLAHLYSTFYVGPFDEAVIVSVDGFGDFASGAWGVGRGRDIRIDDRVYFPHSLGIFYQALTQFLGFPHYGDEYKVMGLAPYGKPDYLNEMRQIVQLEADGSYRLNLNYFRHHKEKVAYEWENGAPVFSNLFSDKLAELLGPMRENGKDLNQKHKDIAHSVQAMYEEAFFHLLNRLHERHGLDAVTLAGGCGMNSVANGKVTRKTPFKQVYIQSAAGDAGGAIGSAFSVWNESSKGGERKKSRFVMEHAFWGPSFTDDEIKILLEQQTDDIEAQGCTINYIEDEATLCKHAAVALTEGKVIGWFQGRMEWGPRALGNRSIVCDPRRTDMKDILNLKIKRRESFRPFAPSILREAVKDWFEQDDEVPFMMKVFQIREEKRSLIPAVTHVDGSGRLQSVYQHTNPRYYHLIECFNQITGVPIVLNTSFNENEPVVCRPQEALDCFLRTKMDVLVLGGFYIERR